MTAIKIDIYLQIHPPHKKSHFTTDPIIIFFYHYANIDIRIFHTREHIYDMNAHTCQHRHQNEIS